MDDTKWFRWLRQVTRETTMRGIARAAGVSHTTVRKWVEKGVPVQAGWELTVRFRADPIETLVMYERVPADQVHRLNFAAVVEYAPTVVMTDELHRRALTTRREYPHIKLQRREVAL